MKKIKRLTAACLTAVVLVAGLAGCGKKDSGEKVSLRIALPGGVALTSQEVIDNFKELHPEYDVTIEEAGWSEAMQKINIQIGSGDAPDLFFTDSGMVASLGAKGAVLDLSERIEKDLNKDDFTNALYAGKDSEGHVWGIPHAMNPIAVLYNKTMFDEAGLEYPTADWTYEDMISMAEKLTKKGADGQTEVYGFGTQPYITAGWLPFILSTGGAPLDETRTKATFTDEKTVAGLARYADMIKKGTSPTNAWMVASGHIANAFFDGKIAMIIGQSDVAANVAANSPEGFEFDVQIMPVSDDGVRRCVYVPNQWVIYSRSSEKSQDAAWEFIKYYLSEEGTKTSLDTLVQKPILVRKSAMDYLSELVTEPANFKAYYEGIDEFGVTLYENAKWSSWKGKVDTLYVNVLNGEKTAEDAAKEMNKQVQEILDEE